MQIKLNALELTGYRLPIEAEWELACRARTIGWYGFGEPISLLEQYAWSILNSGGRCHAVEGLLPNANGLFDMYGNVWEWAQHGDSGPNPRVNKIHDRVLRGGALDDPPSNIHSGSRINAQPRSRSNVYGFRPARTYHFSPLP